MGYIKHNTIIVTSFDSKQLHETRDKAIEIFERSFDAETKQKPYGSLLVGEIVNGLVNGQCSFFIAPDGSKEGWETSYNSDIARRKFLDWLSLQSNNYCDYIEIQFGGDNNDATIIRKRKKNKL